MNKHLKLTQRNYVGYTGQIGRWSFVEGVSVEPIPLNERIRIAANIKCIEIESDGAEGVDPSPAVSIVLNYNARLSLKALPRQSEAEKAEENVRAVMSFEKPKQILSREAIEGIASESGIAGLREIAGAWGVKSKSIPVLMQMILDEQKSYIERQTHVLTEKGVPADEIAKLLAPVGELAQEQKIFTKKPKIAQAVVTAEQVEEIKKIDIAAAAASGDLAAGLNAQFSDGVLIAGTIVADKIEAQSISIIEADRPE